MSVKIRIGEKTIIPSDYAPYYEALGLSYTSEKGVTLPPDKTEALDIDINSYGRDVYTGSEIYTKLKSSPAFILMRGIF